MVHKKKATEPLPDPDVEYGIKYWESQPANYDGVLGGYGNGSLPRVDALGSRQFLMYLLPELCTVPSAIRPLNVPGGPSPGNTGKRRTRALDIGAGVGRVTADVLLHLFSDVVLVEPVDSFISEALRRGKASEGSGSSPEDEDEDIDVSTDADVDRTNNAFEVILWKGIRDKTKSVTFIQGTLQDFDPSHPGPTSETSTKQVGRVGYNRPTQHADPDDDKFDVIWCQWCLGALSDADLVHFFRRCKAALRDPAKGIVVVKENQCSEVEGAPRTVFDKCDSSLTRSDLAWKKIFADAGMTLVHEETQRGFPAELYRVKMYALR